MTTVPPPVFCPFALLEIAGHDPLLFAELLAEFRINAAAYVAQLSASESLDAWIDAAHKLKGAAQGFGALALAEAAAAAEAAHPGDRARLAALRHEVERLPRD